MANPIQPNQNTGGAADVPLSEAETIFRSAENILGAIKMVLNTRPWVALPLPPEAENVVEMMCNAIDRLGHSLPETWSDDWKKTEILVAATCPDFPLSAWGDCCGLTLLRVVFLAGSEILGLWCGAAIDEASPPTPQQVEGFVRELDDSGFTEIEAEHRVFELQRLFVLLTQRMTAAGGPNTAQMRQAVSAVEQSQRRNELYSDLRLPPHGETVIAILLDNKDRMPSNNLLLELARKIGKTKKAPQSRRKPRPRSEAAELAEYDQGIELAGGGNFKGLLSHMTSTGMLTNVRGRGYWPTDLGFHLYETHFGPVPPRQREAFAEKH
jgi:hypothetical protein